MTTVLLVVVFLALVAVFVLAGYQMVTCPFMWVFHLCCGTMGNIASAIAWVTVAIFEGVGSALSS